MANKEKAAVGSHEQIPEAEQFGELAHERREAIRSQLERAEHHHKKREQEQAHLVNEAVELAGAADQQKEKGTLPRSIERRKAAPSKKQREQTFKAKMRDIQSDMDPTSRAVSKLIHIKAVEKASDAIGATLARPNAMLSGSIAAFIGVTVLYFTAKHFGFRLSGFETIAAFALGWVIGIMYDYVVIMVRGRKR